MTTKDLEFVFVVYKMSEYVFNGEQRIHIEGFSGMQVDEKIVEKQFHSYDRNAKNKKSLLAKIRREFGRVIYNK